MQTDKDGLYVAPVSSRQFYRPQFAAKLVEWLNEHHVEKTCLALALGENTVLQDIDYTTELFNRLQQAGVHLVLDKYGTGYLSLQHFCDLSFHYLRIDPYFMRDFSETDKAAVIVRSMIDFAHGMNMHVIATGVETPEAEAWLHGIDCDYIQFNN